MQIQILAVYLHTFKQRAISSAGSEHLVYTEGVGGSNPSSPTIIYKPPKSFDFGGFFYASKKQLVCRYKVVSYFNNILSVIVLFEEASIPVTSAYFTFGSQKEPPSMRTNIFSTCIFFYLTYKNMIFLM